MLDELLKKLKKSLPPSLQAKLFAGKKSKNKKGKDSDDENEDEEEIDIDDAETEEDEESDNDATEPRLKKPASKKKNSKEDESDDDENENEDDEDAEGAEDEEESEEELKKKKKQKIVRGAIIAGIVLFVLSELMPGDDEFAETPETTEEVVPVKLPGGLRQAQETTETTPAENTESPVVTETPVVEQEVVPETQPAPVTEPTVVEMQPEPTPTIQESEPVTIETTNSPPVLGIQEPTSPMEFTEVEEKPIEKPRNLLENIADELNKKLDYTPPPDYLNSGRGLVYNCKGKHWACVDRESYFQCRSNFRWSQQEKKEPECGVRDVYETLEDCRVIQVHYINMSEPTDFCSL